MNNDIDENLNRLIKNWFYNLNNSITNESILFIIHHERLKDLEHLQIKKKDNLDIHNSSKYLNYRLLANSEKEQIIMTQNTSFNFDLIHRKLLIVPINHNFIHDVKSYINTDSYIELDIDKSIQYKYWLQKENLLSLIQNYNAQDLHDFVTQKIETLKMIDFGIMSS